MACKADVGDELVLFPPLTHPFLTGVWHENGTTVAAKGTASNVFRTATASTVLNSITALNIACNAASGDEAIWYNNQFTARDGSATGDGYLAWGLMACPDASYGSGATGAMLRMGMYTSGAITSTGARPSGRSAILEYNTAQSDTNWQLCVHNGTDLATVDTGLAFSAQAAYLWMLHSPRGGSATYAYICDVTNGSSGSATTARNTGSTALARYCGACTLSATARNIRFQSAFVLVGGQI